MDPNEEHKINKNDGKALNFSPDPTPKLPSLASEALMSLCDGE